MSSQDAVRFWPHRWQVLMSTDMYVVLWSHGHRQNSPFPLFCPWECSGGMLQVEVSSVQSWCWSRRFLANLSYFWSATSFDRKWICDVQSGMISDAHSRLDREQGFVPDSIQMFDRTHSSSSSSFRDLGHLDATRLYNICYLI